MADVLVWNGSAWVSIRGPKGDPGQDGSKGDPGTPGTAATVTVGNVVTGPAGSQATVTNSGTAAAAKLDFQIPAGAKGDKGDQGDPGKDGTGVSIKGTATTFPPSGAGYTPAAGDMWIAPELCPTPPYPAGTKPGDGLVYDGTTWKNVGSIQGPAGAKGDKGDTGDAATVQVGTVQTVADTDPAAVSNSGTTSAAILNFSIPRGAKGEDGKSITTYSQAAQPSNPSTGDIWFQP